MYFGSHVSISKGYLEAAKHAYSIGAKAFQYFPKNPKTLSIKRFNLKDLENCRKFSKEHDMLSIGHSPYPTNPAIEQAKRQMMVESILNDLEITEACGSIGTVIHFGKYKGPDPLIGYQNIIALLNLVTEKWNGKSLVLIENQAALMGTTLEELVQIRNLINEPQKVGFCFDTCHGFASGIWENNSWRELFEKGMALGYFPHLKAIHLNDSMFPSGSFHDRHESIGKGYIGKENMMEFLKTPLFREIPIILETHQNPSFTHQDEIKLLYQEYI